VGHASGVDTGSAAANHNNSPGKTPGNPTEQNAAATIVFAKKYAPSPPTCAGDFAHRLKQRQALPI